ncbi:MAG: hypothetical protein HY060_16675 [Proteobacteria bacterium]|nr:hypothetical protein [Pseudomonadota bacterium]
MTDKPDAKPAPAWATKAGTARTARIDIQDTPANAVLKLVGNDRAAADACIAMVKAVEHADPDAAFGPFTPLLILEQIGLSGARIGRFYRQVCGGDAVTALAVLHAVRLKLVPADIVKRAADGKGRVATDKVLDRVRAELPRFGR